MKHKIIIFLTLVNFAFAQVSLSDLNRISNEQLDAIRAELKTQEVDTVIDEDKVLKQVSIDTGASSKPSPFFGYAALERKIDFFDNLPVPSDFKLGPGDVITISLWGETNLRKRFPISRDGTIFYENIGFINLSNSTINEAEDILIKALSSIYSTLNDNNNSTELKVELESVRSINIYVTGQAIRPGINLVHPYSDIYTAIIQAGGIKKRGSLRNIQLKRNDKIIEVFDLYSLLIDGKNNFSSLRILDGDTIHIPEVSLRVNITGEIDTPGYYELLPNETLSDLIYYSGLKSSASSSVIINSVSAMGNRLSDDNARTSKVINFDQFTSYNLRDGDDVNILQVTDVQTNVEVLGNVRKAGYYPASSTLKEVLDLAGGFGDPTFRKSILENEIVIIRKDASKFYNSEFVTSYDKSDSFQLIPEDKILVYENTNYDNYFLVSANGALNKTGVFAIDKGTTLKAFIQNYAGGFTLDADEEAILVKEAFNTINNPNSTPELVNNISLDYVLQKDASVTVLQTNNLVEVKGNVYNPGLIEHKGRMSLKKYIKIAGGYRPNTKIRDVYVQRKNGNIKKVSILRGAGISIKAGDTIIVPSKAEREFNITSFIADLATTFANIAAILVIIDNQSD